VASSDSGFHVSASRTMSWRSCSTDGAALTALGALVAVETAALVGDVPTESVALTASTVEAAVSSMSRGGTLNNVMQ
jgi:hypothetical protein